MTYNITFYNKHTARVESATVEADNKSQAISSFKDDMPHCEFMGAHALKVKTVFDTSHAMNMRRGQEPIFDNEGVRHCNCEDFPCCGH